MKRTLLVVGLLVLAAGVVYAATGRKLTIAERVLVLERQVAALQTRLAKLERPVVAGRASTASSKTSPKKADRSTKMQADRQKFMEGLIEKGIFAKVDIKPGFLPKVWVTSAFMDLDFDTKQSFINVVFAYCYDEKGAEDGIVMLMDNSTGKLVGKYAAVYGGLHLE